MSLDVEKLRESGLSQDKINQLLQEEQDEIAERLGFDVQEKDDLSEKDKAFLFDVIYDMCRERWEELKKGEWREDNKQYVFETAMQTTLAGTETQAFWKAFNKLL